MLGPSWRYLGVTWWLLGSTLELASQQFNNTYLVEICYGASTPDLFIKRMHFDSFNMCVINQHQNIIHGWNARIVLALRLCS